jgi:NADH-quinone oxidoreductase subunit N
MPADVLNYGLAAAEISLAVGICLVLVVDLFVRDKARDITYLLSLAVVVVTAWLSANIGMNGREVTFYGSFVVDPMTRVLKLFSLLTVAIVFLYSRKYLKDRDLYQGEFFLLSLFALLGVFVLISANSLLTAFLGLELMSLSLYAMVAFDRESPKAAEAAMKYFVLGAIASGVLLYGMSIIYGVTGSLQLDGIATSLAAGQAGYLSVLLGLAFILIGVAFKLGAVPFHMWLPDVYEGAPTSVTLFVATVPKLAGFAMAVRLLVEALAPVAADWQSMMIALAILSLALGNIVAIAQTNIKRMLAYSTISHVGFILIGFIAGSAEGLQASLFYSIVYVLATAGAFGGIILLGNRTTEADELTSFRGLNDRSPWFAAMLLLLMVSMIGLPPFAGFYAKWAVLSAIVARGEIWIAVVAVLFSVVGAFYYLRVIRLMYFEPADENNAAPLQADLDVKVMLSLNALAMLALGIFPNGLLALCLAAFR